MLNQYKSIGWDFDGTLVGHKKSHLMWRYIIDNRFNQKHYIVTHRSHGLELKMFEELAVRGSSLREHHFDQVFNVPDALYEMHAGKRKLILMPEDFQNDPYVLWKGSLCSENGIQVLIDDNPAVVLQGCQKYKIDFIHADDLCL